MLYEIEIMYRKIIISLLLAENAINFSVMKGVAGLIWWNFLSIENFRLYHTGLIQGGGKVGIPHWRL